MAFAGMAFAGILPEYFLHLRVRSLQALPRKRLWSTLSYIGYRI